jgi:predicted phosphate transport protein (TIGR00153 family)
MGCLTIREASSRMSHIVAAREVRLLGKWSLFHKDMKFFAFFEQQADNIVKMAQQLKDMVYVWQNVKERAGMLADMEQDGDAITHDIMTLMHRSFITPIDREDISSLAHSLDDIADRIHAVADTLYLYRIESPNDRAKELCDLILKATLEVKVGVAEINTKIRQPEALEASKNINQIENSGDVVYRTALAELFVHPNDIASLLKWREIYKKMESTIDGCETFANVLEGIAAKYG